MSDVDRALYREDDIVPTSGFAASVMEAVRLEVSESSAAFPPLPFPPLPFPWKRALPGAAAAGCAVLVVLVAMAQWALRLSIGVGLAPPSSPVVAPPSFIVKTAAALLIAVLSIAFSMRLATREH